jgi:hypothetical protein
LDFFFLGGLVAVGVEAGRHLQVFFALSNDLSFSIKVMIGGILVATGRAQSLANDINKAATGELDDSALRARVRATLGPQVDQIPDRDGIIAALESTQNQIGQQRLENLQNYLALTT